MLLAETLSYYAEEAVEYDTAEEVASAIAILPKTQTYTLDYIDWDTENDYLSVPEYLDLLDAEITDTLPTGEIHMVFYTIENMTMLRFVTLYFIAPQEQS